MIVLKFGGTSVTTKKNIEQIKNILKSKDDNFIVVVSAFSTMTNSLEKIAESSLKGEQNELLDTFKNVHFDAAKEILTAKNQTDVFLHIQKCINELESICEGVEILRELSPRTRAKILSFGEILSSFILFKFFEQEGVGLSHLDSRNYILAEENFLNGRVDFEETYSKISSLDQSKNYIAGGFIASNMLGETVLLGRGGSDYTASIYARCTEAKALEIWSDTNGIHSADPRKVKNTVSIEKLSYKEAFEMAYFGAKVLYPPTVLPVMQNNIPLYLKNTLYPEQIGTFIGETPPDTDQKIKGVSSLSNIAILTVSGVALAHQLGKARRVFEALETDAVNVILITQSCSEQSIGIGVDQSEVTKAVSALNREFEKEISQGIMNEVKVTDNQCIIAVVGDNMKSTVGLCGKVFGVIGQNGINVTAIAQGASERNISIVVAQKDESKALHAIHEEFFSNIVKYVHLFIAGVGNVGKAFLDIIESEREKIKAEYRIDLKVIGVANSTKMLIGKDGLSESEVLSIKETGTEYNQLGDFINEMKKLNYSNSIFIDNTASNIVSDLYPEILKESVSVVTCNKIACSSSFDYYTKLLKLAKDYNCHLKYETSVGAALPVIKTIHDLIISGDHVHKIQAVISGSLNFIFNEYDGNREFSEVVNQAKEEGYTEPNPLIDLSGVDVMRKILILSRETGRMKEIDQIDFNSFLPDECSNASSNDELFKALSQNESHFNAIYSRANSAGNKLKVVAQMEGDDLSVELMEVDPASPFYNLEGKDNVVALYTDRYPTEPLVIKGAGAGAQVTASGVFADLMFIVRN